MEARRNLKNQAAPWSFLWTPPPSNRPTSPAAGFLRATWPLGEQHLFSSTTPPFHPGTYCMSICQLEFAIFRILLNMFIFDNYSFPLWSPGYYGLIEWKIIILAHSSEIKD